MVNDNVRTVRFMAPQYAEDLYRCEETGKVYVRQTCDDEYVRWLTSCKWQGGYEADCPFREGLKIHIVDKAGDLLFQETIAKVDGYMYTVAHKAAPFSGEAIKSFSKEAFEKYSLQSYEEWKAWLLPDYKSMYTGYIENWLFSEVTYEKPVKICDFNYLGKAAFLTVSEEKHEICGKSWKCYEIRDKDNCVLALCGYRFERGEHDVHHGAES